MDALGEGREMGRKLAILVAATGLLGVVCLGLLLRGSSTAHAASGKTRIVFDSNRDGDDEIFSMRANGTHQHQLTHNTAIDRRPAYSPIGKRIDFDSDRAGPFYVVTLRVNGTNQRRITHRAGDDFGPAYSPNGKHIA